MRKVLVVSRTKMRNGVCVGGIDLTSGLFVRLHTEHGANLSCDAPYNIGEIWDLELMFRVKTLGLLELEGECILHVKGHELGEAEYYGLDRMPPKFIC